MTASDLVSIMTFANSLEVKQDFTADRDLLTQTIKSFQIGAGSDLSHRGRHRRRYDRARTRATRSWPTRPNSTSSTRTGNWPRSESAAKMLADLPEKKALVYFSSGVSKTGMENQSQLRSTINAAVRANVAFYPIDARGLTADPPGGDASQAASARDRHVLRLDAGPAARPR